MKFLVVIDRHSPVGAMYADLCPPVGGVHVGLACSAMDASNPYYIHVTTLPTPQLAQARLLLIPHSNVVLVVEYRAGETPRAGFL